MFDGLYRPDRPRVVEAVLNRSFQKDLFGGKLWLLKLSKIDLLTLFWDDFYAIPTLKHPTKLLETSKLFRKPEICPNQVKNNLKITNFGPRRITRASPRDY